MLPLILAGASMIVSAAGQNAAGAAAKSGAKKQLEILRQGINKRREIQDDLSARNKPYYDQGVAQIPGLLAMSGNPDFAATDPAYGDKYSLGARDMLMQSMNGKGRNLVPLSELNANFNASEQGRLMNRKLDQLKIGYGQAGTAGQSLMSTGSAIADVSSQIGNAQANARSLQSLNRQNLVEDTVNGGSYAPLYLNYKRLNGSGNGSLYDSVGGDINKINFGNF
jgi:hypothetical protein